MERLDSKFSYYRILAGSLFAPILFFFFIYFFCTPNIKDYGLVIFYCLDFLLAVRVTIAMFFYFKSVIRYEDKIVIKSYWTDESVDVPISDIVSVVWVNRQFRTFSTMSVYRITYWANNKKRAIKFVKSYKLWSIEDMNKYLGIESDR